MGEQNKVEDEYEYVEFTCNSCEVGECTIRAKEGHVPHLCPFAEMVSHLETSWTKR